MNHREWPVWLASLDDEDLHFLKRFLVASGSLKEMAEQYGVSYPTVRQRLDRLIEKVRVADDATLTDPFERRLKILIAEGHITVSLAKELLALHRAGRKGSKTND